MSLGWWGRCSAPGIIRLGPGRFPEAEVCAGAAGGARAGAMEEQAVHEGHLDPRIHSLSSSWGPGPKRSAAMNTDWTSTCGRADPRTLDRPGEPQPGRTGRSTNLRLKKPPLLFFGFDGGALTVSPFCGLVETLCFNYSSLYSRKSGCTAHWQTGRDRLQDGDSCAIQTSSLSRTLLRLRLEVWFHKVTRNLEAFRGMWTHGGCEGGDLGSSSALAAWSLFNNMV